MMVCPGCFGQTPSLLLDTIKELFEGSEALFRGLDIHDAVGLVGGLPRHQQERPHSALAPMEHLVKLQNLQMAA